ncbi:MAG: hypothetical protein HWE30_17760 [Methylocystaceae bacterium]|nr:hypothetical protein [Methylocystaceae bacterium]
MEQNLTPSTTENVHISSNTEQCLEPFLTFLADITSSLAWPVVILIIALHFRKHIISAINNLRSLRYGDAEAIFEQDLDAVSEKAKSIEPANLDSNQDKLDRLNELSLMANSSPTGAILEAWNDIEEAARDVAENSGIPLAGSPKRPLFKLQSFLSENNLLPKAEIDTFRKLRMIRNRAIHTSDTEITAEQAKRYIKLTDRLIDAIKTSNII